jgi:hypothetical protein
MAGSLGGADGDPGAPTINVKKRQRRPPWEVSELEIRERPSSMLGNINGVPLMGADGDPGASTINVKTLMAAPLGSTGAGDLRAPTINAKKHQWQTPWEVLTEI